MVKTTHTSYNPSIYICLYKNITLLMMVIKTSKCLYLGIYFHVNIVYFGEHVNMYILKILNLGQTTDRIIKHTLLCMIFFFSLCHNITMLQKVVMFDFSLKNHLMIKIRNKIRIKRRNSVQVCDAISLNPKIVSIFLHH